MCTDFPGSPHNGRGARSWWPPGSKGMSLTPNANRMTEATGVKTEFWKHVHTWDTVRDQLPLYDSNRNKPGLCKILSIEAQFPKPTFNVCLPLWPLGFSPVTSAYPFPPTWGGGQILTFFLQTSQSSFICSKKVTSAGLETTSPVFKINIISS